VLISRVNECEWIDKEREVIAIFRKSARESIVIIYRRLLV